MARPRKARVEGEKAEPVGLPAEAEKPVKITGHPAAEDLAAIVEAFKEAHPDTWETLALCPLQHGLDVMIEALGQD